MKILYDSQIFESQTFGGISRYFYELIKNIEQEVQCVLPLCYSNNHYIKGLDVSNHYSFFPNTDFKGKHRIIKLFNRAKFRAACKNPFDIFHPTYYDPYFLQNIGSKPFVLTVHDLTHERFKDMFPADDPTLKYKRILCEKATKIIAISESTKRDLIEIYNIDPAKIEVVYLGHSMQHTKSKTLDLPPNYILFTGQRGLYKNFDRFAQAFSKLDFKYKLICTGKAFDNHEIERLKELNIYNRVSCLFASESELMEMYSRASLFVFPSLYEGFGIPILEAFAANCPIVLSNVSSLPEVAQDAGVYFDPYDVESIYRAMKEVLDNPNMQQQMVSKGLEQLSKFSWEKMSSEILNIYKSLV